MEAVETRFLLFTNQLCSLGISCSPVSGFSATVGVCLCVLF